LADFFQGQLLIIVQRQDQLFLFRKNRNLLAQQSFDFLLFKRRLDPVVLRDVRAILLGGAEQLVEPQHIETMGLTQDFLQCRQVEAQIVSQLGIARGPAEAVAQAVDRPFDHPDLEPQVGGRKILAAHVVNDLSPDPQLGIRLERDATRQVKSLEGIHQADDTGADQVVVVMVGLC